MRSTWRAGASTPASSSVIGASCAKKEFGCPKVGHEAKRPQHGRSVARSLYRRREQGFYKACKTAKALKRQDPSAKYPHWTKKFRTTVWKNTAIKRRGDALELSTGRDNPKIAIQLPAALRDTLRFVEVRWSTTGKRGAITGTSSPKTAKRQSRRWAPTRSASIQVKFIRL